MNQQVCLAAYPSGAVQADCFRLRRVPVPEPADGEVLVRNIYLSCDPYMRGRMSGHTGYAAGFALDEPVPARVVGQVAQSRHPDFADGDFVWDFLRWENFTLVRDVTNLRRIDPALGPISHAVSVLGMPGRTAEVGMLDIAQVRAGETVFVSAASGAVGSVAGQLARAAGARVIGSAGTDAKVRHCLDNLGFDAVFNYRTEAVGAALDRLVPDGVDVYFDNVGGETLDAVLARLKPFARIPVCGMISQYDGDSYPLRNVGNIVGRRATMTGFIIYDYMDDFLHFPARMAARMAAGEVRYFDDIVEGIENTPAAFIGMLRGDNVGKRLVRVGRDPTG
ncbi:MAG: NADP-dependent oxidoreductase [Pseudomonadales bacterium]|nr:NADP-dependent oxidoreductase [Pseudomonadales bacterium]